MAVCLSQPIKGDHSYHVHVLTDGAMHPGNLSFLQPLSHFKATTHPLYHKAVQLFRPCSSERLYLHEHADFKHLEKVMPPADISSAALCLCMWLL